MSMCVSFFYASSIKSNNQLFMLNVSTTVHSNCSLWTITVTACWHSVKAILKVFAQPSTKRRLFASSSSQNQLFCPTRRSESASPSFTDRTPKFRLPHEFGCCKRSHNRTHDPSWETASLHLHLASVTKRLMINKM